MKNTFKSWFNNSDTILLLIITLFFWTMLFVGIFYSDVPRNTINLQYDDLAGFIGGNIIGSLLVILCSILIPRYLIRSWIRFKNTGKW
jgi:hypothetical protein